MNSRQRRKRKRFSERMFQTLDLSGIGGVVRVGFLAACRARRYWKNTLPPLIDVKDWDVTVEVVE